MNNDDLRLVLEEHGLDQNAIEEIIISLKSEVPKDLAPVAGTINNQVFELQRKIDEEKDWKKRAQLAARIISLRLEE